MKYDYNKMKRTGIEAELRSTDWDEVCAESVEESWGKLRNILLDLQHRFVPRVKYGKSSKVQWLNHRALKYVRRKHKVYRRYKDRSHVACKKANMAACYEVKKAKYNFERKLAENIKKDTKSFYAYVRNKAGTSRSIGPIINGRN